jgi:hypothetical protein
MVFTTGEQSMTYINILQQRTKDQLVNDLYNISIGDIASYNSDEKTIDSHGYGKRIPYIGEFWRNPDFVGKDITIGDCGDFIGVMENNKWGYAQRRMTSEEVDAFIEYLEKAFVVRGKGGSVAESKAAAEEVYNDLWSWFQTLRHTGDWCANYQWEYDA